MAARANGRVSEKYSTENSSAAPAIQRIMGVRRTSVTAAAGSLQEAGLISYRRGHIQLLNLDGIGQSACQCHATIKANYDRIFPALTGA